MFYGKAKGMKLFQYLNHSIKKYVPICTCAAHFSLSEPEEKKKPLKK